MKDPFFHPDWPRIPRVHALVTQRSHPALPGHSAGSYAGLNLGDHVGDEREAVRRNRADLVRAAGLPAEPHWLEQVHGDRVVALPGAPPMAQADACWTAEAGVVLSILTADCLPVFLADQQGETVGLAHAGWRGLARGVIGRLIAAMPVAAERLQAWLGPAIGPGAFQVGEEVRECFLSSLPRAAEAFRPDEAGRWRADLYALARQCLAQAGVQRVSGGQYCTHTDAERFFSHRREAPCGRMASLIWLQPPT